MMVGILYNLTADDAIEVGSAVSRKTDAKRGLCLACLLNSGCKACPSQLRTQREGCEDGALRRRQVDGAVPHRQAGQPDREEAVEESCQQDRPVAACDGTNTLE